MEDFSGGEGEARLTPSAVAQCVGAIADAALEHRGVDAVLAATAAGAKELLAMDVCAVLLLDETGRALVARPVDGRSHDRRELRVPLGEGFARDVAGGRRAVAGRLPAHGDALHGVLGRRADGAWAGAPLLADGRLLGAIAVGRSAQKPVASVELQALDVTADRAARAVTSALAHDRLVTSVRDMRRFLSLAAHELRTPAAAIYGIAATLHNRDRLGVADTARLISMLYEQSERFGHTVDQLLDLSRLDHETAALRPGRIAVRRELETIVAGVAGAVAIVDVAAPADLYAVVDRDAFGHVVTNLVANAIRHGQPPVTISAENRDTHFRLDVRDDGNGVDTAFVPHLFEPFRRGAAAGTTSGAGLGLAIARSYAQALGGDLLYEPARPRGARFTLVVPQTARDRTDGEPVSPAQSARVR